jgi:predicted TIM-barrel fold metal-dependent hydrolase
MSLPLRGKIDVHNHFVPPIYAKGSNFFRRDSLNCREKLNISTVVEASGGDPSGWKTPKWSASSAQMMMEKINVSVAILSVTAPGVEILPKNADQVRLAREINRYGAQLHDEHPSSFGFFATLPSLLNTEAAISEIKYALDELHADGVTLFTRYGNQNTYLGHASIRPIWEELNKRKAVVFIHPTHPVDINLTNRVLPQPVLDYPHETTRTAFDLVLSGTKRAFPDCKIILSHGGGTLPFLLPRVAELVSRLPESFGSQMSHEQIIEDAKSFYFDLALATSPEVLGTLLKHFSHDRILFGSDMPYAQDGAVMAFNEMLDAYPLDENLRLKLAEGNAKELFPRLK